MESGGDGGSEASYESVASEGAYEPAAERGRDPLPRIISSSNCVEVFRRLYWDGAWACRAHSPDGDELAKARAEVPVDPLESFPRRLMRFDGAIEAWLEELPMPLDPHIIPAQYQTLNDAQTACSRRHDLDILKLGNKRATIWYFTVEFLQQLWPLFISPDERGLTVWKNALLERSCNIKSTHVEVGRVDCPPLKKGKAQVYGWLKSLFSNMQASKWCPNGESRTFLMKQRLTHASMSIGDCVQIGRELYVVGLTGFVQVDQAAALLPPGLEEDLLLEDADASEAPAPTESKKKKGGKKARHLNKLESNEEKAEGENNSVGDHEGASNDVKGKGKKHREKKGKDGGDNEATKGGKGGKAAKGAKGSGKGKTKENGSDNVARQSLTSGSGRLDRRHLRKQLQAERDKVQTVA